MAYQPSFFLLVIFDIEFYRKKFIYFIEWLINQFFAM